MTFGDGLDELTITETAFVLGLHRDKVEYRVERGGIPYHRPSGNPRGKRVILTADICDLSEPARELVMTRLPLLATRRNQVKRGKTAPDRQQ